VEEEVVEAEVAVDTEDIKVIKDFCFLFRRCLILTDYFNS
jgi:hypothetical protein